MPNSKNKSNSAEKSNADYEKATLILKRYRTTSKPLYKAILKALPALSVNDNSSISLTLQAGEVMDSLGELSRKWAISIHWLYTVCNPKIDDASNVKYSPVYGKHASKLPPDHFGELSHLDEDDGKLFKHGNKIIGDNRFPNADFGTSWNDKGEVINHDSNGHPILDGFAKTVYDRIEQLQNDYLAKPNRDRHFEAFMIAHTRDVRLKTRDSEPEHKPSHFHIVLDLPTNRSRYQVMKSLGVNFDDYTDTFQWISTIDDKTHNDRVVAFLKSLQGDIKNFNIQDHYKASLQYLVHQSKAALRSQKTPYNSTEVICWLPDEPDVDYEHLANIYNNEAIRDGINSEVLANLHSPYNTAHNTSKLVGSNKLFSIQHLSELRHLARKKPGSFNLTKHSKVMVMNKIMSFVRDGSIQINEWQKLIHASLDDDTADSLLKEKSFNEDIKTLNDQEIQAIISDPNHDRNMTTIIIVASTGGIGKSRLAVSLAKYYDHGRMPHLAASLDKSKTYDAYQDYDGELSSVLDEIDPSSISITQLKDMLDPHKTPSISSRNHNVVAWNVHHTFLTNVYPNGVGDYIQQVMRYSPGVVKDGYLESNDYGNKFSLKKDSESINNYRAGLSQLIRRLPIVITLKPTPNQVGTRIIISRINFKPSGRGIANYDYVHTFDSDFVLKRVINDDLSDADMAKVAKHVAKLIDRLNADAQRIFQQNPNAILNETNGFISDNTDFGMNLNNINSNNSHEHSALFNNDSSYNLIKQLNDLSFAFKSRVRNPNMNPDMNQLQSLLDGNKVPYESSGYDSHSTIELTDKGLAMIKNNNIVTIMMQLNNYSKFDDIIKQSELFQQGTTEDVYAVKIERGKK